MKLTFTVCGQTIEYPQHLCENIPLHEARVLGTIVNDLSLMCEIEDKSNLFHTKDGIIYYELLKNMYQNKVIEFDAGAVQAALNRLGDDFKREFIAINGNGYLNAIKRDFSEKNFESHLQGLIDDVQKLEIYKNLYSNLCDMTNNTTITSNNVINMLEDTLENTRDIMEISGTKPIELNIDSNYIQSKIDGVKRGLGYGLYSISKATRGLHLGNVSMLSAFTNVGKALPLTANIYTPNGYVKMKDIKLGDIVYDMDGKQCKVIGVFPQGIKDRYEVVFKDGSKVECCDEHLWVTNTIYRDCRGKKDYQVESLKEIMNRKLQSTNGSYVTFIPVNKPIEREDIKLPINPYILGCLIGDGSIKSRAILSSNETDIVNRIQSLLPKNHTITKCRGNNFSYLIKNIYDYKNNEIIQGLKELKLFGLGSHEKFIPDIYLNGSINQRLELLKGLFDTDGSICKTSGCKTITTTSVKLKDDIIHLCHTLGYRATFMIDKREYKHGQCYTIIISTYDEIFTSQKHRNRVPKNRTIMRRNDSLSIVAINKLTPCEMQCIMVDSPTHTYLTDNMIVTHNTTVNFNEVMLSLLDAGESIFIYSNESTIDDFKDLLLIRTLVKQFKYYQLTRTKLNDLDNIKNNNPELFKEFMIKISQASQYINQHYHGRIILYSVSKYSIAEFNMLMRRYALRGFKYFLIDTMKSEEAGDINAVGKLIQQSRNIYEAARNLNTHVMVSYQIASYLKQNMKRVLDESCLSGSKQVAEILDILICMRELYPDEYTGQRNEVRVFKFIKNPEGKGIVKDYRTLETGKKYLILFLPKNRYGAKILPTIYEFNGEFGTVSEVGYSDNIQDKAY